jgi:hypothetical protein
VVQKARFRKRCFIFIEAQAQKLVIPARAGIYGFVLVLRWIAACAGMTN